MNDAAFDGGAYGVSSTVMKIEDIVLHHKAWTLILFEMYQQASNYFYGELELENFGVQLSLAQLYRTLREPKKSIFKEGLDKVYNIIKTTNRNPTDLSFDLRTMRLKRKELFLEEMDMLRAFRKNLLSPNIIY
jgi:hypothetical protein